MKVTTVRFGEDLWALLEAEAAAAGVSVSQYIREAALARAAFSAGARAGVPVATLAQVARRTLDPETGERERDPSTERLIAALMVERARGAGAAASETAEETTALVGQARQAARRAGELRRRRR
jgi:Ribbon-helix-helix protein, copG family